MDLRKLAQKDEDAQAQVLTPRDQVLNVRYHAPDGKSHEGPVTSRILDGDERLRVATRCGQLAQAPWERLPLDQAARILALVTVAIQLRDRPEWLDRWMQVDDTLLFSLYAACLEHAERYFRGDAGQGADGQERPRVELSPASPAGPARQPG
jgi:hypothetical protein